MRFSFLYFPIFFIFFCSAITYSQETGFSLSDSIKSYHIVTLKDGTVLKGKILKQEHRRIDFQDEVIGNVSFRTKEVASMEKVEPQDHYLITLMNGTTLQGKIVSRKEKEIVVETANLGNITVDISKIKNIRAITPANLKDGKYWFKTPVDRCYLVTSSSIPLEANESYFQNIDFAFNRFQMAMGQHFSLGGGVFLPAAGFLSPHIAYKLANGIYAGAGGFVGIRSGNKKYMALGYGALTFGSRNAHLTIGMGYGGFNYQRRYYYNYDEQANFTLITGSGMIRLSPKCSLFSENWFDLEGKGQIFTGGIRLMSEKNSWDFGFARIYIGQALNAFTSIGPFPIISYMRSF